MIIFPEMFFVVLVYLAIGMSALGGSALLVMVAKDWKGKNLW